MAGYHSLHAQNSKKEQKRQQLLTQLAALGQPVSPELQSSCIIESDSVVPIVRMMGRCKFVRVVRSCKLSRRTEEVLQIKAADRTHMCMYDPLISDHDHDNGTISYTSYI